VEVLGVTRAYATRHGAGPLPTHDPVMTARLSDPGNPANAWQDSLRAGPLDLVLLAYAARSGRIDGIVVNGLDHLPGRFRVCRAYRDPAPLETPRCLREQERLTRILEAAQPVYEETTEDGLLGMLEEIAPVRMVGRGPSSADRTLIRAAEPATVPPR
jgi:adenylosuccinate synthase